MERFIVVNIIVIICLLSVCLIVRINGQSQAQCRPRSDPNPISKAQHNKLLRDTYEKFMKQSTARLTGSFSKGLFLTFNTYWYQPPTGEGPCTDERKKNAVRKEYRQMDEEEMELFHKCLQRLKNKRGRNGYDQLTRLHEFERAPFAHDGRSFIGWHRYYLYVFEQALQSVHRECNCVTVPYYDNSIDRYLPSPSQAVQFSRDFWGAAIGPVRDGKLCPNWPVTPSCRDFGSIVNRFHTNDPEQYYTDDAIALHFEATTFEEFSGPYFQDITMSYAEMEHGNTHCLIGGCGFNEGFGHLGNVPCSPNDAIFFLHHAFVDLLFREWEEIHGPAVYPPCDADTEPGHCGNDDMRPFRNKINRDGLGDDIVREYQERPSKLSCQRDEHCLSKQGLLWCDRGACRCKCKVQEGGNCRGLPNEACYCNKKKRKNRPRCRNNRCRCVR